MRVSFPNVKTTWIFTIPTPRKIDKVKFSNGHNYKQKGVVKEKRMLQ